MIESNLKRIMKTKKLSILEVSKMSGISRPTLYLYIRDISNAKIKTLEVLGQALGVNPKRLFTVKENK